MLLLKKKSAAKNDGVRWKNWRKKTLEPAGICSEALGSNFLGKNILKESPGDAVAVAAIVGIVSSLQTTDADAGAAGNPEAPAGTVTSKVMHLPRDELDIALEAASTEDKTLIIAVVNQAYAVENSLLDLFLHSFLIGDDTEHLLRHLLVVAVDQTAFDRCKALQLHCYKLVTDGVDFSGEKLFMSEEYLKMMWMRTLFLGDVLRRGYSHVFTDADVMWLRNPLKRLRQDAADMQFSCDAYNGNPNDNSNPQNNGFYFVRSNKKTIRLFEMWYEAREKYPGMNEQDVLRQVRSTIGFVELGVRMKYLDTLYFSGFCEKSRDFLQVNTMHANCCKSVNAKLADLRGVLQVWEKYRIYSSSSSSSNSTFTDGWPEHRACLDSWH